MTMHFEILFQMCMYFFVYSVAMVFSQCNVRAILYWFVRW